MEVLSAGSVKCHLAPRRSAVLLQQLQAAERHPAEPTSLDAVGAPFTRSASARNWRGGARRGAAGRGVAERWGFKVIWHAIAEGTREGRAGWPCSWLGWRAARDKNLSLVSRRKAIARIPLTSGLYGACCLTVRAALKTSAAGRWMVATPPHPTPRDEHCPPGSWRPAHCRSLRRTRQPALCYRCAVPECDTFCPTCCLLAARVAYLGDKAGGGAGV